MTQSNGNSNGAHEPTVYEQYAQIPKAKRFTAEPVLVTLNSGLVALLRPVGLDLLIKTGRIPDLLTPMIMDALNGRAPIIPTVDKPEEAQELVKYLDLLCELAFVAPKVVADPHGEEEISAGDIPFADKFALQYMVGQPRKWLENFRPVASTDVRPVGTEPGLPPATVEAPASETQPEGGQAV